MKQTASIGHWLAPFFVSLCVSGCVHESNLPKGPSADIEFLAEVRKVAEVKLIDGLLESQSVQCAKDFPGWVKDYGTRPTSQYKIPEGTLTITVPIPGQKIAHLQFAYADHRRRPEVIEINLETRASK